jgi:hypothetical protein
MPTVLIFLGAGASKALADIPTMKGMVDLFERQLLTESPDFQTLYKEILDSLRGTFQDRLDLEAILSVLNGISKGRTFKELGFYPYYRAKEEGLDPSKKPDAHMQSVAKGLLGLIEKSINSYCEIKPEVKSNLFGLYSKLTEMLQDRQNVSKYEGRDFWRSNNWAIYTTNYDLSIETVCKDAGIEINTGAQYDKLHLLRIFHPESLRGPGFKIIKLHGSISWYMREDGLIAEYPEGKPPSKWEAGKLREQIMLYPIEEKAMYEEPYIILLNQFREDLWFRLNVFPINIPPLRERKEDIPALVHHFIGRKSQELRRPKPPTLMHGAIDRLMAYSWPGNVRELENVIERAMILDEEGPLKFDQLLPLSEKPETSLSHTQENEPLNLDEVVSRHIQQVLKMTRGKVHGPGGAAELLGINPSTLRNRMDRLGVSYGRKKT